MGSSRGTAAPNLRHSASLIIALSLKFADANLNSEVGERVNERLEEFMNVPKILTTITTHYRNFGGFPHDMNAVDRDFYLLFGWTMMNTYHPQMIYYGLENGLFLGQV